MPYRAPAAELRFLLTQVAGIAALAGTGRFADLSADTVGAVLEGAGALCDSALVPVNRAGDLQPARLEGGRVVSPPGFAAAYRAIAAGGWIGIAADPAQGGMGLPFALATAVNDMMAGACLALQLNPLLTQGQIEAIATHADPSLRALVLPRLIAGDWSGTMNLTEPQAGSDVGALTTRAEPAGDGTFRVTGQKIYITWGDCDFVENVSHLVLARLPDAPAGSRGISLFWVPRDLPGGGANALRAVGLEHKLGLHGSPTAVMAYEGARGWLVGPAGGGLAAMFTMMNNARVGVAAQGVGIAEAAFQQARAHARDRVQGGGPIIAHPEVRRMLATMQAEVLAARTIMLDCALAIDMAAATGDAGWAARAGVLTPIAKAFCTDTGHDVAQMGVQVHGGAGYIEQTGAAQFVRDVRVTQIYEGTNGIQALDLAGRKLSDGGAAVLAVIAGVEAAARAAAPALGAPVLAAAGALRAATLALIARPVAHRGGAAAAYLRACARVLGAGAHLRAAAAEPARAPLAAFYIARLLPEHAGLLAAVADDPATLSALGEGFGA